jgi:hypothetical protein
MHLVEPRKRVCARTGAQVGDGKRLRSGEESVHKEVQTPLGADIHFLRFGKVKFQVPTLVVFNVGVEEVEGNLLLLKVRHNRGEDGGFAGSSLASHGENDAAVGGFLGRSFVDGHGDPLLGVGVKIRVSL